MPTKDQKFYIMLYDKLYILAIKILMQMTSGIQIHFPIVHCILLIALTTQFKVLSCQQHKPSTTAHHLLVLNSLVSIDIV